MECPLTFLSKSLILRLISPIYKPLYFYNITCQN